MAEHDPNDEYKFDDLESFDQESHEPMDYGSIEPNASGEPPSEPPPGPPKKDIRRNALIAVGAILLFLLLYKLLSGFFLGKKAPVQEAGITPAPVAQMTPPPAPAEVAPTPVTPPPVSEDYSLLKQKVDSIESAQQNVQSQISTMNDQMSSVNSNVNNLSEQINKLNQTINELSNQLANQSQEIGTLMARTRPKAVHHPVRRHAPRRVISYHLNAVIPGRAWLIAPNGSTLTVREGTKIPGYGVVKLIDSVQGRVLTSSGRVIRFSQEDS